MDYLRSLRIFVAIADAGSLAGGARKERVSAPSATRALAGLETHLGARLVQRSTRSFQLTEVGETFLTEVRHLLSTLESAEAVVTNQRVRPEGLLSVTAPELFGQRHIGPLVLDFLKKHPLVNARTFFTNRIVNLIDEGFDVALRIADLPDSGLTAVSVGTLRIVTVAAPSYLEKHGTPETPADLQYHDTIGFTRDGQDHLDWDLKYPRGSAPRQARLVVNTNAMKIAAAVAGHGIARALAYQVLDEVRDGRLSLILTDHEPTSVPVHLVYPAGRAASAKVREFVRFAAIALRATPVLQGRGLGRDG